jgi:hypothetical protein
MKLHDVPQDNPYPGRYDLTNYNLWGMNLKDPWFYVNGIEIAGVKDYGEFCERIDGNNETPDFYSVYIHAENWGCECVGDYATRELALADAEAIRQELAPHITEVYDDT